MTEFKASDYSVFLADDNPENLSMLSEVLEDEGYRVRAARNGKEVLDGLEFEAPDLLLLDVHMPVLDGYDTCRRVRSDGRFNDLPILFISALKDSFNRIKGFDAGANDYIDKPFNTVELLARMRTHLLLFKRTRELKQSLTDLDRYQASLIEKEKYSYLALLVSRIAHEINTPLGNSLLAITSLQNLLKGAVADETAPTPDETRDLWDLLTVGEKSIKTVVRLVNRFRELEEFNSYEPAPFDLLDVTKEIFESMAPEFSALGVQYRLSIQIEGKVLINYRSYFQILMHLIRNTLDHGLPCESAVVIQVEARSTDSGVQIVYRDNGCGIEESVRSRVWDPFFTTGKSGEHLGLGLHLVFLLVKRAFGGDIRLDDPSPEGGTVIVFTIDVPITQSLD